MASQAGPSARHFFKSQAARQAFKVLAWVPVGIFFTRHVYSVATVTGASMQPTLNPDIQKNPLQKDIVLLERWRIHRNLHRGDVVTLWSPSDPNLLTTKRVVGVPGDIVHPLPPHSPTLVRIPEGHCWVEGDSTYQTRDSNTYGPVPIGLLDSKVTHVIWPSSRWGQVKNESTKSKGRVRRPGEGGVVRKIITPMGGLLDLMRCRCPQGNDGRLQQSQRDGEDTQRLRSDLSTSQVSP